jgi:hypothetical protein
MISSRPFVDPKSGWLLQGSGGVSFAIYLLLRLIFTGRYLVDYPSVFNFPFNQTTAIQKTRTVARACTALLICDIDTSLERARRVTQSVRHSNELRFVPYPQPVPQACLPAGPSCGSSSGIGLESTTVHKTADTRAKLKAKQAIELLRGVDANDPTNVGLWDNGNQRSDRQKVYMVRVSQHSLLEAHIQTGSVYRRHHGLFFSRSIMKKQESRYQIIYRLSFRIAW